MINRFQKDHYYRWVGPVDCFNGCPFSSNWKGGQWHKCLSAYNYTYSKEVAGTGVYFQGYLCEFEGINGEHSDTYELQSLGDFFEEFEDLTSVKSDWSGFEVGKCYQRKIALPEDCCNSMFDRAYPCICIETDSSLTEAKLVSELELRAAKNLKSLRKKTKFYKLSVKDSKDPASIIEDLSSSYQNINKIISLYKDLSFKELSNYRENPPVLLKIQEYKFEAKPHLLRVPWTCSTYNYIAQQSMRTLRKKLQKDILDRI